MADHLIAPCIAYIPIDCLSDATPSESCLVPWVSLTSPSPNTLPSAYVKPCSALSGVQTALLHVVLCWECTAVTMCAYVQSPAAAPDTVGGLTVAATKQNQSQLINISGPQPTHLVSTLSLLPIFAIMSSACLLGAGWEQQPRSAQQLLLTMQWEAPIYTLC